MKKNIVKFGTLQKHHIPPLCISFTKVTNVFELIHIEIWGSYQIASFYGAKYFFIYYR